MVQIEFSIIRARLVQMLQFLLPANATAAIDAVNEVYLDAVPLPPVFNYHSYYMDQGALPLQYVKIVGDKHIPKGVPSYYL